MIAIKLTKYIGKNSYLNIALAKSSVLNNLPADAYMKRIPRIILNVV
jgi:hypothetical protein